MSRGFNQHIVLTRWKKLGIGLFHAAVTEKMRTEWEKSDELAGKFV